MVCGGEPPAQLPRIGSFQPWTDTIGGIIAHTSLIDGFLGNLDQLYEQADEDAVQWAAFLHAWRDSYKEDEVLTATVAKDIRAGSLDDAMIGVQLYNTLPDELSDLHKGDLKKRLGKALSQRVGSQFDESGLHLVKSSVEKRSGAIYWKVAGMQVLQVSIPQKEENSLYNTSLSGLESGLEGGSLLFSNPTSNASKPVKPAHLQEDGVVDWQSVNQTLEASEALIQDMKARSKELAFPAHLKRLQRATRVSTPQGPGTLMAMTPWLIDVHLDETGRMRSFIDDWHFERIFPLDETLPSNE